MRGIWKRHWSTVAPAAGIGLAVGWMVLFPTCVAAQTNPYNSITLDWVASGDDSLNGQVSGYEIRYGTSPDPENSLQTMVLGPPLVAAGQTQTTVVTGLTPGTQYYFVVRAFDDAFNFSDYSNIANHTTQTCAAPTAAPASFAAVASAGQVDLTWGGTPDPLAQSIHLYRAVGINGSFSQIQDLAASSTGFTDTNVSPGQIYRYRAAYAGPACEGPSTAQEAVTVPGPTAPPPGAAIVPSSIHVYPNPATTSLRMVLDVQAPAAMPVYIRLFDKNGRWIATLANASYPPGVTEVAWNRVGRDGRTVGAGYYEVIGTVGLTKVRERLVLLP